MCQSSEKSFWLKPLAQSDMSGVAPPSGAGGTAASVGSAALHGAQRGAAMAQKGVVNLTIYVQRQEKERNRCIDWVLCDVM